MPSLIASYKTKEEVPAALAEYYKEENGEFILDAEDMEPKSRVDGFRTANIALKKYLEMFGVKNPDPTKEQPVKERAEFLKTLEGRSELLDEKKLIKDDKVEDLVNNRLKKAQEGWNTEKGKMETTIKEQTGMLSKLIIEQQIVDEAAKLGVKPWAVEDVKNRGLKVFKLEEGAATAYDANGEKRYGKDTKPLTIPEFMQEVLKAAPDLFEPSKGSGASGSGDRSGTVKAGRYTGPNPFKKETRSQYWQGKLVKENPEEAKRLAAEAGVKLNIP